MSKKKEIKEQPFTPVQIMIPGEHTAYVRKQLEAVVQLGLDKFTMDYQPNSAETLVTLYFVDWE